MLDLIAYLGGIESECHSESHYEMLPYAGVFPNEKHAHDQSGRREQDYEQRMQLDADTQSDTKRECPPDSRLLMMFQKLQECQKK